MRISNFWNYLLILASTAIVNLMLCSNSHGQESDMDDDAIEELVVTATKRDQSIQDVPLSITAFSAGDIVRNGFSSLLDYGNRIPNLSYGAGGESRTDNQLAIAIRGVVGNGTTGFYIDESPLLESINPAVIELQRIEVLRGPQGTLYGARSMGGTVRLITKQPVMNKLGGNFHSLVSTTTDGGLNYKVDGVINVPVIEDRFALRMLGYTQSESGFLDRVPLPNAPVEFDVNKGFNDSEVYGGQISARLSFLNEDLVVTPRLAFEDISRGGRSQADIQASNRVNMRLFDIEERNGADWQLGTLTINYDRPYGEFVSSTSYFQRSSVDKEDGSEILNSFFFAPGQEVPVFLAATDDNDLFSQEVRFSSSYDGPFQFTGGVFFQDSEADLEFLPTTMEGLGAVIGAPDDVVFTIDLRTKVQERAVFVETTYDITDKLTLIGGLRYFDNEVDFMSVDGGGLGGGVVFAGVQQESDINPKFGLQYHLDEDRMVYVTGAKGFRIGGVNSFNATDCAADISDLGFTVERLAGFKSDSLWNYEAGIRSSWMDRKLTVNASVFFIDWSDLQQRIGLPNCGFFVDVNVGAAENKGFEVELDWLPVDDFSVFLGIGYTNAEIVDSGGLDDTIPVGSPVQNAPEWTVNTGFDYDFAVFGGSPMYLHADVAYIDESFNGRNSGATLRTRPSYTITNISTGVKINNFDISLFVNNVSDEAANLQDVPPMVIELDGRPRIAVNRPRTVGIEFRAQF